MDCSPPGSSVRGISPARILEWVVISFSRGSSLSRVEPESPASPSLAGGFFTTSTTWETHLHCIRYYKQFTDDLKCTRGCAQVIFKYSTILCKGLGHLRSLVSTGGPEINPPWILSEGFTLSWCYTFSLFRMYFSQERLGNGIVINNIKSILAHQSKSLCLFHSESILGKLAFMS